jgi:hypothetical protein
MTPRGQKLLVEFDHGGLSDPGNYRYAQAFDKWIIMERHGLSYSDARRRKKKHARLTSQRRERAFQRRYGVVVTALRRRRHGVATPLPRRWQRGHDGPSGNYINVANLNEEKKGDLLEARPPALREAKRHSFA